MNVFILCAGEQKRFLSSLPSDVPRIPKQLLLVNNTSILRRTIDQVTEYNTTVYVITRNWTIINTVLGDRCNIKGRSKETVEYDNGNNISVLYPSQHNTRNVCESLLSSRGFWSGHSNLCLLGDVFYTDDLIKRLMTDSITIPAIYYGSYGELFAILFQHHDDFIQSLRKGSQTQRAKLWESYRAYQGIPLTRHEIRGDFVEINDDTQDIDDYGQYLSLLRSVGGRHDS